MTTRATTEGTLKGVRGWLLLLCVTLVIISPILAIIAFVSRFEEAGRWFETYSGFAAMMRIDGVIALVVILLSIYAGLMLWGERPGAARTAKRVLLLVLGLAIISALASFLSDLPGDLNAGVILNGITSAIQTGIYVAIWYAYLVRSKRVAATYADQARVRGSA